MHACFHAKSRLLEPLELKSENLKRKRKKTERSERSSFSAVLSRKRGPAPLLALRLAAARCSLPCRCAYAVLGLQYAQDLPPSKTRIVENVLSRRHLPGDHTTTQGRPWLSLAYDGLALCREAVCARQPDPHVSWSASSQCQGHPGGGRGDVPVRALACCCDIW